jgi:hypothetical protein
VPSFTVTTASEKVTLDDSGAARAPFTITNTSPQALRGRLLARPRDPAKPEWLTVAGESVRDFAPNGAQQVVVELKVPPGTTPGSYSFRLDAVAEDDPDEDFTEGPSVAFDVTAPPPPPPKKKFPWWILAIVGAVVLLIIIGVVIWLVTKDSEQSSCVGRTPTMVGTEQADVINGTEADDVIVAGGGGDQVSGLGGNDVICGGSGDDTIQGGDGTDVVTGQQGDDFVDGGVPGCCGPGNSGDDIVRGEQGRDQLHASDFGNNTLEGGEDNDVLHGWQGNDTLEGGDGEDALDSFIGNDTLRGGNGDDQLDGGAGTDFLDGGPGRDSCVNGEPDINCE